MGKVQLPQLRVAANAYDGPRARPPQPTERPDRVRTLRACHARVEMPFDFSSISVDSRLGRTLRAPLKLIPKGTVVRLQGPLRGARWIVGSSTAGCWLGSYELSKVRLFASTIRSGMTVFDIGAHAGYYTLIASKLVGGSGHVVAFEPAPRNVRYLRRHLSLNHVSNVTVLEVAVSDRAGVGRFDVGAGSYLGRLDPAGTMDVRTTTLDELVTGGSVPSPHFLKLDIEGAESDALVGAAAILREARPAIFLATHGSEVHNSCLSILRRSGYSVQALDHRGHTFSDELIARPSPIERG
jgi:FkbM family methyltransferase